MGRFLTPLPFWDGGKLHLHEPQQSSFFQVPISPTQNCWSWAVVERPRLLWTEKVQEHKRSVPQFREISYLGLKRNLGLIFQEMMVKELRTEATSMTFTIQWLCLYEGKEYQKEILVITISITTNANCTLYVFYTFILFKSQHRWNLGGLNTVVVRHFPRSDRIRFFSPIIAAYATKVMHVTLHQLMHI